MALESLFPPVFPQAVMSRNGSAIVVSGFENAGAPFRTVKRWTLDGEVVLQGSPGFDIEYAHAISADGRHVLLHAETSSTGPAALRYRLYLWDTVTGSTTQIPAAYIYDWWGASTPQSGPPVLHPNQVGQWPSLSGAGDIVAGVGSVVFEHDGVVFRLAHPFNWSAAQGTTDYWYDHSYSQGNVFRLTEISGDGTLVAGEDLSFLTPLGTYGGGIVFRRAGQPMEYISSFDYGDVRGLSWNGSVMIGTRRVPTGIGPDVHGYRWTAAEGFVDLGNTFGPRSISDDGSLITGAFSFSPGPSGRVWTASDGMRTPSEFFGDYGITMPVGYSASAGEVSGDGSVFRVGDLLTKVGPLSFVGMGDSFSSGEGAPGPDGYLPGSNTQENQCHRSPIAYAGLARPRTSNLSFQQLGITGPEGFSWEFIACSGAETANVLAGTEPYQSEPPQLSQGVLSSDTDLVTISIGGNDTLFSQVIEICVFKSDCFSESLPGTTQPMRQYLPALINDTVRNRLLAVYGAIRGQAPNATVVVMGYPRLVSGVECSDADLGAFFIGLSEDEQREMRNLGDFLNETIASAARQAGVHFLGVADVFERHNVCDLEPWINGIVFTERVHSFHPNARGQQAYATVLQEFLESAALEYAHGFFESGMPRNPPPMP